MPNAVKSDKTTKQNNKASDELKKEKSSEKETNKPTEIKAKESTPGKGRSVSFNRDVHVKRFGKTREARGASGDTPPPTRSVRREPFTHLSEQQLIAEAEKVLEQAGSVSCSAQPPEKFFSLPYRKKHKPDPEKHNGRRRSEELGITSTLPDKKNIKTQLARSTSDVSNKSKKSPKSSLTNLFRKTNRSVSPETLKQTSKPIVKRSKSDVSDLKSYNRITSLNKPIRTRSGSESEENLNSVRTRKNQLSPIIELNPREDYFRQNSSGTNEVVIYPNPSEESHAKLMPQVTISAATPTVDYTVNPIEKPPRFKNTNKNNLEPKPPQRTKRSNTLKENKNSHHAETKASNAKGFSTLPKKKAEKKSLIVDEIDKVRDKDINPKAIKKNIKNTIQLLKNRFNPEPPKDNMVHSSQQPADKLPLTKGNAVENIVKILKEDQLSPAPKSHLINPPNAVHNVNQPFSYIRPGISLDPSTRASSPPPTSPVAKMNSNATQGVVYAQVVCNQSDKGIKGPITKQTVHKTYPPTGEIRYGSDEDEGLGYEESKYTNGKRFDYGDKKVEENAYGNLGDYRLHDSPITPRFKDFKLTTFIDYEPTYANHFPIKKEKNVKNDFTVHRGRGDGMDSKRSSITEQPNDLSYRRAQLESRMNARRLGENISSEKIIPRFSPEEEYIAETADRMKATEKYVNETARYYRSTIDSGHDSVDGLLNSNTTDEHLMKIKHHQDSMEFEKFAELDRRQFLDRRLSDEPEKRTFSQERKRFPPEPEYEPPSLESHAPNPVLSPDEYVERKYKIKSRQFTTSQDALNTGQKYVKDKQTMFGSRKGHYASNPEIAQEREDDYVNFRMTDSYNSFVKRDKQINSRFEERSEKVIREEMSGGPYEDYDPAVRRIYDNERDRDNKFVDSGIENDFRKDSNGEINRGISSYTSKVVHKQRQALTSQGVESDDEGFASSQLIASERRHTEDNHSDSERRRDYRSYPDERYGEADYSDHTLRNSRRTRERSRQDGSPYDPRRDKLSASGTLKDNGNGNAKSPKSTKKISGLEKVKQLFSRDSSKKSRKEKEASPVPLPASSPKRRTRVLKSPEQDELRSRYTEYRGGSSVERDSGSELRTSKETTRKSRSRTGDAERRNYANDYSQRRRLATPSPTPSPLRRADPAPSSSWFKSLDRLTKQKSKTKVDKESVLTTTEDESTVPPPRKAWNTKSKASTPTKNLRFFGDTDPESGADSISKHKTLGKTRSLMTDYSSDTLTNKRSISASASGIDVLDRKDFSNRMSNSMSNLVNRESRNTTTRNGYSNKHRDLHNISEIYNHSEADSNVEDKSIFRERRYESKEKHMDSRKPPQSPFRDPEKRSRSRSASKGVKSGVEGSRSDLRRMVYQNGKSDLRNSEESRDSSSEIRRSRQELSGSRSDLKPTQRPTLGTQSGESSTEGDSSLQSQRSVVFLHATTVGDIPNPGRTNTGSRDDVSQVKTVTKTFNMLAPWRPRLKSEANDVNYSQSKRATKRTHKQHQISPTPKTETSFFGKNKSSSTKNLTSKYDDRSSTPKYDDGNLNSKYDDRNLPSKYNDRNSASEYGNDRNLLSKYDDRILTSKYDDRHLTSKYDRSLTPKYDDRNSSSRYDDRINRNGDLFRNGKSASQTTLTRRTKHTTPSRLSSSNATLYKKSDKRNGYSSSKENINTNVKSQTNSRFKNDSKKSVSTELVSKDPYEKSDSEKISRSISMPKDPKKSAGWFRLAKKNKKPDHSSRVR